MCVPNTLQDRQDLQLLETQGLETSDISKVVESTTKPSEAEKEKLVKDADSTWV